MFKVLHLISLYQNGVGYSKYGFNEILPYEDFVTIMDKASNDFMKTSLNAETMMELFDIVSDPATRNFKNYLSMTNPVVTQPSTSAVKPESLLNEETLSYFKSGVDQGIEAIKKQYEERLKNLEYLSKKTTLSGITQDEYDKKVNYINAEYNEKISKVGKMRYRINLESARDIELAELKRKYEGTTQPSTSVKPNMINDSIKDTQLDLFNQTPLTFGGKSINEQLEIMNTPEFKSFFAEETIKNPNLDASEALDYYIKCKGL